METGYVPAKTDLAFAAEKVHVSEGGRRQHPRRVRSLERYSRNSAGSLRGACPRVDRTCVDALETPAHYLVPDG